MKKKKKDRNKQYNNFFAFERKMGEGSAEKVIDYFGYDNPLVKLKTFFSLKARRKMYNIFLEKCNPTESTEILDLGVTPDKKLEDSNFFEKWYPYKKRLTICSIEDCEFLVSQYGLKGFLQNRTREALPFKDKEFDVLFCSAVIEHVGTREEQRFFISECCRISNKVFITTPNRYFPIEMHTILPFLHWLPWSIFQKIVRRIKGDFWADTANLNLLSKYEINKMFPNVFTISYIRTMGFKSNLIIENTDQ